MSVKVKVINKNPKAFDKYSKSFQIQLKRTLGKAGMMVRNTAVQSILSGGKSGKVYEKYNPRRTHRSSGEGQAPASDTGFLASNIVLSKINEQEMSIEVESRAEYSEFLEFGTQNMKARPFMFPALEENKPKIRRMFKQTRGKAK
tara:strand:- start:164 stop:598 length:435 start_codon:yes stop_codon:yes gene_type:complete